MSNPVSQVFRFILKLVLGLSAAIFTLSLLAAALVVVVFSLLKALLTGRKPAPAALFGHFQQFSTQGMRSRHQPHERAASHGAGSIVDVEVREIREEQRQS